MTAFLTFAYMAAIFTAAIILASFLFAALVDGVEYNHGWAKFWNFLNRLVGRAPPKTIPPRPNSHQHQEKILRRWFFIFAVALSVLTLILNLMG